MSQKTLTIRYTCDLCGTYTDGTQFPEHWLRIEADKQRSPNPDNALDFCLPCQGVLEDAINENTDI